MNKKIVREKYYVVLNSVGGDSRIVDSKKEVDNLCKYSPEAKVAEFRTLEEAKRFVTGPKTKKKRNSINKHVYRKKYYNNNKGHFCDENYVVTDKMRKKETIQLLRAKGHESKGETLVEAELAIIQLKHLFKLEKYDTQVQVMIDGYKNVFDFGIYDSDNNLIGFIEYDGPQHTEAILNFGGEEGLKKRKYLDRVKEEYCKQNNYFLLRLSYKDYREIHRVVLNNLKKMIRENAENK